MILPTAALPVNAILLTSGCCDQRRAAGLAETGDDVDHAGRQAAIGEMFREFQSRQRSLLGGLQHAGAACGQRGREFPCRHEQRIIPRDDLSGNADRLFERQAHGVIRDRIHITDDFGGESAVVFETGGNVVEIVLSLDDGFAGVAAFEFGERGQVLPDFVGKAEQNAASLLRGRGRPWAFFERGLRRGDGAVDVVGRGVGDLGDHFFGRGIVYREGLRGLARDPFAIDEHLVSLELRFGLRQASWPPGAKILLHYRQRGSSRALYESLSDD